MSNDLFFNHCSVLYTASGLTAGLSSDRCIDLPAAMPKSPETIAVITFSALIPVRYPQM
jgi:hypothetical protein